MVPHLRIPLAVFFGGALGVGGRLGLSLAAINALGGMAFLATLLVNCMGAALIGYLATQRLTAGQQAFWMAGFCGGFTTFSMVSLEIVVLAQRAPGGALAYGAVSLALWLCAVWAGSKLGRARAWPTR